MFNRLNLYDKPLIEIRAADKTDFPPFVFTCHSSEMWSHMEAGRIEKIIAMRVYANQNCIVFKMRLHSGLYYVSRALMNPELRILKLIYDQGQEKFCFGIKHYLSNSIEASNQYIRRDHKGHPETISWYADMTMGKNV